VHAGVGHPLQDVVGGERRPGGQVHDTLHRPGLQGRGHRLGRGFPERPLRVVAHEVAVEAVAHLGDGLPGQQWRHPHRTAHQVLDQVSDVPLGVGGRQFPLVVGDLVDVGHQRLGGDAVDLCDVVFH
jgi:hypothetical protein